MSLLSITRTVSNGTTFTFSQNDTQCSNVETWANGNIDSTNIATGGVTTACLAANAVTQAKIAANAVGVAQVASDLSAALVPTGMIAPYGASTAPTGWLICDGTAVSRTTYAALFNIIGTNYGYGDNSTTFNVPDLRGRFLRGWDHGAGNDPDASGRTAMNTGGQTGDNVGSVQTDQYASHTHTQNAHNHTISPAGGTVNTASSTAQSSGAISVGTNPSTLSLASTTATNNNSGGNETRPKNANVQYIIKT